MVGFDIKTFAVIIVGAINFILGAILFGRNPKDRLNQSFAFLTTSIALWAFAAGAFQLAAGKSALFLTAYILYAVVTTLPPAFLLVSLTFPPVSLVTSWLVAFLIIINAAMLGGVIYPLFVIQNAFFLDHTRILTFGGGYYIYALYFIIIFSLGLLVLLKKYIKVEGVPKSQLRDLLIGTSLPIIVGLISNLILPWFGYYQLYTWLGQSLTIVFVFSIAYAIVRHRLLNIKVIAAELFTFSLAFVTFLRILFSGNASEALLNIFIFLFVLVAGVLLIRSTLKEIRDKERIEKLATELEHLNKELLKLDEAKSEFISIASHQLRTPLTVIRGYVSMLIEGSFGSLGESAQKPLRTVMDSASELIRLVNDLLDLSRIEAGKISYDRQEINFEDLVLSVISSMEEVFRTKKIDVNYSKIAVKHTVLADAQRLSEAVMNIIDNAIKYSQGEIDISFSENVREGGKNILLAVKDNGIGIKAEDLPRLFTKFMRSDEAKMVQVEGLGIGLYFVRRVVEDHGGRAWAESAGVNQGSTFYIELPVYK